MNLYTKFNTKTKFFQYNFISMRIKCIKNKRMVELMIGFSMVEITSIILTIVVIYVNGLTDAPNSVATCITTGCMSLKNAVFMSAFFNIVGVVVMTLTNSSVAETILTMVDFGQNYEKASIAVAASLFSIVLWAVIAWWFGIPTSESHALIAGVSGGAIAVNNSLAGVNSAEWLKAVYGLFTSCFGGFILGYIVCKCVMVIFKNVKKSKSNKFFTVAEIVAAASMSFMHGAQDGQKFFAVLIMCAGVQVERSNNLFVIILCALVMGLGTATGGKKIIKSVGMDMVRLEKYQGFSADTASSVALFLSTVLGFPVSTTHAKTTAMIGAGAAKNKRSLNTAVVKDIVLTWVLTFPCCGALGFFVTKIFLKILL